MRYYVYGLIDPRDYRVRYVGRTSQRMDKRLEQHIGAAQRGAKSPVYRWLRELLPAKPWLACLEICDGIAESTRKGTSVASRHPVEVSEVKWIKRFRRDCLNDLEHEQCKRDWKNLVNPDEVSRHD